MAFREPPDGVWPHATTGKMPWNQQQEAGAAVTLDRGRRPEMTVQSIPTRASSLASPAASGRGLPASAHAPTGFAAPRLGAFLGGGISKSSGT